MTKYRIFHHSYQQSLKEKHSISMIRSNLRFPLSFLLYDSIALDFESIFEPIQNQSILSSASSLSKT